MRGASLSECPECARHVRAGERACPFCGASVQFFISVPEYRLKTRLRRGQMLALGAALTAAGVACSSDEQVVAIYGAPVEVAGTPANPGGTGGTPAMGGRGGNAGQGGTAGHGGSAGSDAGSSGEGGNSGEGGAAS